MKVTAQIKDEFNKTYFEEIEREDSDCFEFENIYNLEKMKKRLAELTKDFAQVQAGLVVSDIDDKREEFRNLLNQIRVLEGKLPRKTLENADLEV